ncbi:hypothetical protein QF040_002677 [Variovorax sp. W2I14]
MIGFASCSLFAFRGRVSPRQATYFLLLRQKNVSKEKATLLSASLRFASGNLRCSRFAGSRRTRFAQTAASPDPRTAALLGAARRAWGTSGPSLRSASSRAFASLGLVSVGSVLVGSLFRSAAGLAPSPLGERAGVRAAAFMRATRYFCAAGPHPSPLHKGRGSPSRAKQRPDCKPSEAMARSVSTPLWLRRGAERFADQGRSCLSEASSADPAKREHRRLPRSGAQGSQTVGSPFLCLRSFGEAKESKSPAGARPGLCPPQGTKR